MHYLEKYTDKAQSPGPFFSDYKKCFEWLEKQGTIYDEYDQRIHTIVEFTDTVKLLTRQTSYALIQVATYDEIEQYDLYERPLEKE